MQRFTIYQSPIEGDYYFRINGRLFYATGYSFENYPMYRIEAADEDEQGDFIESFLGELVAKNDPKDKPFNFVLWLPEGRGCFYYRRIEEEINND